MSSTHESISVRPSITDVPHRLQRCGGRHCAEGSCGHEDARLSRSEREPGLVSGVPSIVRQVLTTPGRPLEPGVRRTMEGQFGHDLGAIRIHADTPAAASARAVDAVAYTVGSHLVFDDQRYAPATPGGRALLVHELTHAIQQGLAPASVAQHIAVGRSDDAMEREAERATVADGRSAERERHPDLLRQFGGQLGGRDGLAIRRQQPNAPAVMAAGPVERREFVEGTIHFLELSAEHLSLSTQMPPVARLLGRWRQMLEGQAQMVLKDLGADPALYQALRAAYKLALSTLIDTAARLGGRTAAALYEEHRASIPEWAFPARQVVGITTPLPTEAQVDARRRASLDLGGLPVIFLPDGLTQGTSAETTIHFTFDSAPEYRIGFRASGNGRVMSFTGPGQPQARIQTLYPRGVRAGGRSAYGRGTASEDVAAGETTLGFHEGQHGRDILRFIRSHPFPRFTGRAGMTVRDFEAAMADYEREVGQYKVDLLAESVRRTHCVGTTIDQYNVRQGIRATIECR